MTINTEILNRQLEATLNDLMILSGDIPMPNNGASHRDLLGTARVNLVALSRMIGGLDLRELPSVIEIIATIRANETT